MWYSFIKEKNLYILGLQDPSGALRANVRAVVYADPAVRYCIRRSYPGGAYGEGYDQGKSEKGRKWNEVPISLCNIFIDL